MPRYNGFALLCAGAAVGSAVLCVLVWAFFWRPVAVLHPAPWLYLPPLTGIAAGLGGLALWGLASDGRPARIKFLASLLAFVGLLVLAEHLLGLNGGIERLLFPETSRQLLTGVTPGRPSALVAMCLLLLSGAIFLALRPRQERFEPPDVFAVAVLFPSFTVALGFLFQADILVDPQLRDVDSPIHLPETLLLMVLALGVLALNSRGVIAGYGTGADAKRRLLLAAILIPSLLGLVESLALHEGLLDATLAIALTTVSGILVSIILIEWISGLLASVQAEQTGELLERETRALEEGMTDMLTGLLNRRGWEYRLQQVEDRYQRDGGNACVVVIDLDGLKRINDTEGHAAGDALIRRAAMALNSAGRKEDYISRLGGDEFCYLAVDCLPQHAEMVQQRLAQAMEKAGVQASLGYAMRDLAGNLHQAFREADQAMYSHKRLRKAAR